MKNISSENEPTQAFTWAIAIFAARENAIELLESINAICTATAEKSILDVLVNGNPKLAEEIFVLLRSKTSLKNTPTIRVWEISLGDKAHAWNQYLHIIWPGAKITFFVDGYVRVAPNAFQLLAEGLLKTPAALGGTGVPTSGRTALKLKQQMLIEGGIHGNLFSLTEKTTHELVRIKFKLPLGIYRTDSTLGAALAFGLDPTNFKWDIKNKILVHPEATWDINKRKWWCYSEVKSQLKRILRQSQGTLENKAVENFFSHQKQPLNKLPTTVSELIENWSIKFPNDLRRTLIKNPLSLMILKKSRQERDWSKSQTPPRLIS